MPRIAAKACAPSPKNESRSGKAAKLDGPGETTMHGTLNQAPTVVTMTLRALARFPERRAFVWDGGTLTYRGTYNLIGCLQAGMAAAGLRKGQTVAFLSANSAVTWCA